jgi:hypothetical protein
MPRFIETVQEAWNMEVDTQDDILQILPPYLKRKSFRTGLYIPKSD